MKKRRIEILDVWRGFAVLGMLAHHTADSLQDYGIYVFQAWNNGFSRIFFWSQFMLIAGISSRLSRSNLKRGFTVAVCGTIVTLITVFFAKGSEIYFGILQFMALSMIIYAFVGRYLIKLGHFQPILYIALFILTEWLTPLIQKPYLFAFFYTNSFFSADYFPLFPWFFIFLFGTWLGGFLIGKDEDDLPRWFYTRVPLMSFIGRKTLIIYMLHKPIIMGLIYIVIKIKN